jgi:hypothetical protein
VARFEMRYEFPFGVDEFWKLYFDKEFNQKMHLEGLHFSAYTLHDFTETETEIRRKTSGSPKLDLPGPVAKLLGSNFGYTEEGVFTKSDGR